MDRSKIVRCKHREDGYITVDKARIDTIECERLIRHLSKFDEVNDKWIVFGSMNLMNNVGNLSLL